MRWYKQVMLLFFTAVLFAGTVGINVFFHFCSVNGNQLSYFVPTEHTCFQEEPSQAEVSGCCQTKHTQESKYQIKSDCCKNDVKSYKVSDSFQQTAYLILPVFVQSHFPSITDFIQLSAGVIKNELVHQLYQRPPPIQGTELLIRHQVFRI